MLICSMSLYRRAARCQCWDFSHLRKAMAKNCTRLLKWKERMKIMKEKRRKNKGSESWKSSSEKQCLICRRLAGTAETNPTLWNWLWRTASTTHGNKRKWMSSTFFHMFYICSTHVLHSVTWRTQSWGCWKLSTWVEGLLCASPGCWNRSCCHHVTRGRTALEVFNTDSTHSTSFNTCTNLFSASYRIVVLKSDRDIPRPIWTWCTVWNHWGNIYY